MKSWNDFRRTLARLVAPKLGRSARMYGAARPSRLSGGYVLNSSSDMELVTSLQNLRGKSRQLVRDASYAKNARRIVQNNVVGGGIGIQGRIKNTRDDRHNSLNEAMEEVFEEWTCSDGFHTAGQLHLQDMERLLIGEVFEAGEVFIRKHRRSFGGSSIPLALELMEAELVADNIQPSPQYPGNTVRMGIEVDSFYRPVGYWFHERFLGEIMMGVARSDRVYFVPASDIIHLRVLDRFPQTRGVPWVHTVIRRLQDMDGYSEAEIVAARAASSYFGAISSPDDPNPSIEEKQEDGSLQTEVEPGVIMKLAPGEEMQFFAPNRPNAAMDPFMRLMLREIAAGVGISYESLSRDFSNSNYSSSRLAILDDRDLWRVLQGWFIRQFRYELHKEFMMMATLAGQIPGLSTEVYANDMKRYNAVSFKPRGWSWIDPTKEIDAYIKAVRAGFDTVTNVIAKTADGRDMDDVLEERAQELSDMEEAKVQFDTDPERDQTGKPIGLTADQSMKQAQDANDAKTEQAKHAATVAKATGGAAATPAKEDGVKGEDFIAGMREVAQAIRDQKPPEVTVEVPAPVIHVRAPEITVNPTPVNVTVDNKVEPTPITFRAPDVNVAAPNVTIENRVEPTPITVSAPEVKVEVTAPSVTVENRIPTPVVDFKPEIKVDIARIEVEQSEESEQRIDYNEKGEIEMIRTRRVK